MGKKNLKLQEPNKKLIDDYIKKFNREEGLKEGTVDLVFKTFIGKSKEEILAKVSVLNQIYSTNLYTNPQKSKNNKAEAVYITLITDAIFDNIDSFEKIQQLDKVIEWVKKLLGEFDNYNGKKYQKPYSFLTKYCSWSFPNIDIPIVDSYSKGMLYYLNDKFNFCNRSFTQKTLDDYEEYCEIYKAFAERYASGITYKEIDEFLWEYGKENNITIV